MGKQILRIKPIHSAQQFSASFRHNYRVGGEIPNADQEKLNKNFTVRDLPDGETYLSFYEKKVLSLPYYQTHKVRKNAVLGYEFMLAYGMEHLPKDFDVKKWAELSAKWLESVFGKENVASVVVHMDEQNPHIHAVVIPIAGQKLRARAFIQDRQAMRNLHKSYYEYTKQVGLEPEDSYKIISHHQRTVFYNNVGKELEEKLPEPENGETLEQYAAKANAFYQDMRMRNLGKNMRIQSLEENNKALERANHTLNGKIEEKAEEIQKKRESEILEALGMDSIEEAAALTEWAKAVQNGLRIMALDKKNEQRVHKTVQILNEAKTIGRNMEKTQDIEASKEQKMNRSNR